MNLQDELTLSYFEHIRYIDNKHNAALVRLRKTDQLYVRKTLTSFDLPVYQTLKDRSFPGIPKIMHLIPDGDRLIIIEEYIRGMSLMDYLNGTAALPDETPDLDGLPTIRLDTGSVILIMTKLCRMIRTLHEQQPPLIHRDIKPSNIILTEDNEPFLIDFNAARQFDDDCARDTVLMGTPGYAAPEQYGFLQSDARTDIYALGVLLNDMLDHTDIVEKQEQVTAGRLRDIAKRCTQMDPVNRYQSCTSLEKALSAASEKAGPKQDNDRFPNKPKLSDWALPGFRTRRPWKILLACLGYVFMVVMPIVPANGEHLTTWDVALGLSFDFGVLACIFLIFDYRGMAGLFPLSRSDILPVRIASRVLWCGVFFVVSFVLAAACQQIQQG